MGGKNSLLFRANGQPQGKGRKVSRQKATDEQIFAAIKPEQEK